MGESVIKTIVWRIKAFTLIEVLVSMVFLLVAFLGLLQAMVIYTRHNLKTSIRYEAVKIAQECVERLRNGLKCTSSTSSSDPITDTVQRQFRNFTQTFNITYPNPDNFQSGTNNVTVIIDYEYPQGESHTYTLNTVVYR